jgi:NADH-quinone oxidoreductase subunit F
MDLHIVGAEPTDAERQAVDRLLGPPVSGWEGGTRDIAREGRSSQGGRSVSGDRDLLLPVFHAVQDGIGWISHGALNYICRRLSVPPAEAWGVVTFYHLLATDPQSPNVAHVCDDIACRLNDVDSQIRQFESQGFTIKRSPCLGQCDHGSAALLIKAGKDAHRSVVAHESNPHVGALGAARLVKRIGRVDPASLEEYRKHGGYSALAKALEMGPDRVIAEVTAARLMGRGGAAFPTGRKWESVARESVTPHYVVCNADESEPGTFKDRVVMELDPFAVIEAMTICGLATGSERGFIYIRGEYPESERAIGHAIAQALAAGLLGPNVMRSGFAFDIEIRRGGGAYICGEETALFNSIEGTRGEPRSKPPFPAQFGLFGQPTVVNNVETLVNVLDIVNEGGAVWAKTGTAASTGSRLFCLSGHVQKPGLYEIECGRTLREAIDVAGGVKDGRALQAVLLGGAAGTFVGPSALDMPLSFEGARAANATLGSGVIMVFDDTADLHDTLVRIAEFFKHESCGQCVPCRIGTVRQLEILEKGGAVTVDPELSQAMRDASICGLGQTASSAIDSAFANIPGLQAAGRKPQAGKPQTGGHS